MLAVVLAACTAVGAPVPITAVDPPPATSTTGTTIPPTTSPPRDCEPRPAEVDHVLDDRPPVVAAAVSSRLYPCADHVTLTTTKTAAALHTAALVAASHGGPLLVVGDRLHPATLAEIERLRPLRISAVSLSPERLVGINGPEVRHLPPALGDPDPLARPLTGDAALWLATPGPPALTTALAVAARDAGAALLTVRPGDLRAVPPEVAEAIRSHPGPVRLVGGFGPAASWQLEVVRAGLQVPGGGQLLFPGRRLVAFYGHPGISGLGVLGEQGPAATADRLAPVAAAYGSDGTPVLPAFEIIATTADSQPGADGDYSEELAVEAIRPWVEEAERRGLYVVLDLQPGRTDFLTQARRYEELLVEPHVGLALDPEWRLGPDALHLRGVGSVSAAEVNTVVDWLAAMVREHSLPQKLLVVHQFLPSMITDRHQIRTPPELAVTIQMDGHGPLATKYETYRVVTEGAADASWHWGWKNFYDLDTPLATAHQVLGLDPVPVYVSYQ